jgi:Xaa-Pro aminopeptidase
MGYLIKEERDERLKKVRGIMGAKGLDITLVYYDEINVGNGWYLTGWCPQAFESAAVLVPRQGEPMILGGPECEPFAKLDSAITETRNFPVFMVPNEEYPNATITDFPALFAELNSTLGQVKRVGLVGAARMPADCYRQIVEGFKGVELVDVTQEYVELRYLKSAWELEQMRAGFKLADDCDAAMRAKTTPGITEIQVAAAGEYAARSENSTGFSWSTIVGSGKRSNAVVPMATSKKMEAGELVTIGICPKVQGYSGVVGDTFPVSGRYTDGQEDCIKYLKEAFCLTKEKLLPGKIGKEIDAPARAYYKKQGLFPYLVCPFVHTIGISEVESPFFGPNSEEMLKPGMTVCVDVSFFGHPKFNGVRIETGYEITDKGPVPMSPKMDRMFTTI